MKKKQEFGKGKISYNQTVQEINWKGGIFGITNKLNALYSLQHRPYQNFIDKWTFKQKSTGTMNEKLEKKLALKCKRKFLKLEIFKRFFPIVSSICGYSRGKKNLES